MLPRVPTVAVYVPAAKWRALEAEGLEPDAKIRQLALDSLDRHLAGSIEGSRTLLERGGVERRQSEAALPRSDSAEVRTDFKKGKK